MFEFDWSPGRLPSTEKAVASAGPSRLDRGRVERAMLLFWREHCLECAPPVCYQTCALYVARADRKCARFAYGIACNPAFRGLLDYGADLRFRRWAKLEARLRPVALSPEQQRRASGWDRAITGTVNTVADWLRPLSSYRRLNGAWTLLREKLMNRKLADGGEHYDELVMECHSPNPKPFRLLVELWNDGALALRQSAVIEPGANYFAFPAEAFINAADWPKARLTIYPENDLEVRLIFTWLDFVKYRRDAAPAASAAAAPAAKIKCVAWDLDNTLWEGVLIEQGTDKTTPRPEAVELIRQLDARGILQTVVSKNDFEEAWAVITRHGLQEYFLHPAINWGAKSVNLRQVAAELNLGVDSFALIDDSPFERAEVQAQLPAVRTYTEQQIRDLPGLSEFDVPITEQSRVRRESYLVEIKRIEARQSFPGDYSDFLRSCRLQLRIFVPRDAAEIQRCHELVQRSNQLNLSSRRYTAEEFAVLLGSPGTLCVAMHCRDRFGDYGIVGFVTVDETAEPRITNLVLSCRVVQKRVEHAFIRLLAEREYRRGKKRLLADLKMTSRNGPLVAVFDDLGFQKTPADGENVLLSLPLDNPGPPEDVITVVAELA